MAGVVRGWRALGRRPPPGGGGGSGGGDARLLGFTQVLHDARVRVTTTVARLQHRGGAAGRGGRPSAGASPALAPLAPDADAAAAVRAALAELTQAPSMLTPFDLD